MTKASRIIIGTVLALLVAADAGAAGVRLLSSSIADSVAPGDVDGLLNAFYVDNGFDSTLFSGAVTTAALGDADLLVSILPEDAFDGDEIDAMTAFLGAGKRILFIGDSEPTGVAPNPRINDVLVGLGSSLSLTTDRLDNGTFDITAGAGQILGHPLNANVETISYARTGAVLGAAAAERLFLTQDLGNVWGASQDVLNGSVIVLGDANFLSNLEGLNDNGVFLVNAATVPLPPALLGFLPALAGLLAARRRYPSHST